MRAIDAAIELCLQAGTTLKIQWHRDPGLNCDFNQLFEYPDDRVSVSTIDYNGIFAQLIKSTRKRIYRYSYDKYYSEPEIWDFIRNGGDLIDLVGSQSVCISSCSRFYDSGRYYSHIHPLASIMAEVDNLVPTNNSFIGIHIRRTDHHLAIGKSPLALFEAAINQEIYHHEHVRFFLATDSLDVKEYMLRKFPEVIVTHSGNNYERSEPASIRKALVELYCLSRTQKIIGSYASSFTEEAAKLGSVPLTILTE